MNTIITPSFAQIPAAALLKLANCTRAEILVYMILALHAKTDGSCYPGRERLAKLTGLTPTTVSKATTSLEEKGLLTKTHRGVRRVDYILTDYAPRNTTPVPARAPEQTTIEQIPKQERVVNDTAPTKLPERLPSTWVEQGRQLRPDLNEQQVVCSAEKFLDYHRAKRTTLKDWVPAWRNWIRNERAGNRRKGPLEARGAILRPVSDKEAVAHSMRQYEAMCRSHGIDPKTGQRVGVAASSSASRASAT